MKRTALWITAMLLAVSLCGCSQLPEVSMPEESEVITSQAEESPAPENSSEIADGSSISFSDSSGSVPDEQKEVSKGAAETTTAESSSAPTTTTPAPQQTTPAANEPAKEPEQPAAAPQQPTENPKPQETPQPTPEVPPTPTEPPQTFDVSQYVSYAKSYGQEIGLSLDSTATTCWDNPLIASSSSTTLERDIKDMLDWYKADGNSYFWVWAESRSDGKYNLYIGYA